MGNSIRTVGVLDKSFTILSEVAAQPRTLGELIEATGMSRATVHRLAVAMEDHGFLRRGPDGRFALGLHLIALGRSATEQFPLAEVARPAMAALRDRTGESAQLYVRDDDHRVCVAALESSHGLRTIVAVGAELPMDRGSAGRVLQGETGADGWVQTVEERELGVASVSAPICDAVGHVVAAISVSGPIERMGRTPGTRDGAAVMGAARAVEDLVRSAPLGGIDER